MRHRTDMHALINMHARTQVSVRLRRRDARDGYERRLPGLGMPRRNDGEEGGRGDLIVHFMVEDGGGGGES